VGIIEAVTRPFRRAPAGELTEVARANRVLSAQTTLLQERLLELELAIDGWQQLGSEYGSDRDFTRQGLQIIVRMARLAYLKNPLIGRAVRLQSFYVWGRGINLSAKSPLLNEVIQEFLDDPGNQAALTSHAARKAREIELQLTGNLFLAFFPNPSNGVVRVRTIPFDEIKGVLTNPDDRCEPWFYRREWSPLGIDPVTGAAQSGFDPVTGAAQSGYNVAYYPDWGYRPDVQPPTIGGHPVRWDVPVCHRKSGGLPDGLFGVPEVYAALDWAKAYKESLEDDATRSKALARYAWDFSTPGGQRSVSAAQATLGTTVGTSPGTRFETNPPAVSGATFIHSEGVDLKSVSLAGATLPPEHNRALRLMVGSATDTPDTMLSSDSDVGNYATAATLDRPTELSMTDRQELWADLHRAIFAYVLDWAARAPSGALSGVATLVTNRFDREVLTWGSDPSTGQEIDPQLEVSFPSLLERDALARVQAIVAAATQGGLPNIGLPPRLTLRLLLLALEVDDVDELVETVYPDGDDADWQPGGEPAASTVTADAQAAITEAARLLRDRLRELQEVA
jgi:hypothetical protein